MVLKFGINPDYVLNKMAFYEINALFKYSYYKNQEDWEQTRMLGFINAKCQGAKNIKLDTLISFPWENQNKNNIQVSNKKMTDEDFKRLHKKAQMMIENNIIK